MNQFISTLLLLTASATGIQAQTSDTPPRIQTSAPAEKTAVRAATSDSQKPAATKKIDNRESKAVKNNAKTGSGNIGNHAGRPYMAVKTNLAYDIFAVMNASFEMQFARHFSAELPVYWSLWDWKSTSGLRTAAIQPGVKYHFSQPGTGHAVGLDMGIAWYNMRHDQRRYQDCGRPMLGASVNYSYTLGLGRGWAMEFAIGAGYVNTRYNTYYNIDNGALIDTRQRNYFGPTRIGVSLVYNLAK